MFNKHIINDTHISYGGPSKIDVTEKRAPTDKSVELLNEMQQKAFDNLITCIKLEDNDLKDIMCWIYSDRCSWQERMRIQFKINGKIVDFDFILPHKYTDKAEIGPMIREEVLKKISDLVLRECIDKRFKDIIEIYKRPSY